MEVKVAAGVNVGVGVGVRVGVGVAVGASSEAEGGSMRLNKQANTRAAASRIDPKRISCQRGYRTCIRFCASKEEFCRSARYIRPQPTAPEIRMLMAISTTASR